jgi:hypothetical protein
MRPYFCIVGLVSLIASLAPGHSRGFAWFFSHSKPSGSCAGQRVVATYYTSGGGERRVVRLSIPVGIRPRIARYRLGRM